MFDNHALIAYHFKILNFILHILCSIIIWYTFKGFIYGSNLFKKPQNRDIEDVDFMAALLFAVHPVHTEAVSGIVGRADVLSALTYFISFLLYHNAIVADLLGKSLTWFYLLMALLCAFISMLFKENGITVLVSSFIFH